MSLRWRIALGLALVAALVGAFAGVGAYVTTARQRPPPSTRRFVCARHPGARRRRRPGARPVLSRCPTGGSLQPAAAAQIITVDGRFLQCIDQGPQLPIDADLAVAASADSHRFFARPPSTASLPPADRAVAGRRGLPDRPRPLETESTLDRLRLRLALVTLAGVVGAAGLGWFLAGRIVRPVRRLRDAAEDIVARTT